MVGKEHGGGGGGKAEGLGGGERREEGPKGGEPEFSTESVFFMSFLSISKLAATSAWKHLNESVRVSAESGKRTSSEDPSPNSRSSLTSPAAPFSSSSSSSPSSASASSSSSPSSPAPPTQSLLPAHSPSSQPEPASPSAHPTSAPAPAPTPSSPSPSSSGEGQKKRPAKPASHNHAEWDEVCLGFWKKGKNPRNRNCKGHCVGISVIRASNKKELDELTQHPVTGFRICILSDELAQEKKKTQGDKAPKQQSFQELQKADVVGMVTGAITRQIQVAKRIGEKVVTGEAFFKVATYASNSITRFAKDLKDKWGRKND